MTSLRLYKKAPNSQKPAGGQIDEYFHAASVWNKRVARKTPLESTAQHRRLYFISIYFNCNRYITGELQTSEMHQSTRLNSYKNPFLDPSGFPISYCSIFIELSHYNEFINS